VVLLLRIALVTWSLAIDECGGHEDLRGLDCQSVIPYVHGRTGLYCSSLPCLCEIEHFSFRPTDRSIDPYEVAPARAFYSSMSGSYNESRGLTGSLRVDQTLCCRAE
jgi:hypothetical protein